MNISYDIGIKIEEEVHTFRVPLWFIRWLLLHVPSDAVLDGIVINALNSITHEPTGDVAVAEICNFFTELLYLELDWQASNVQEISLVFPRKFKPEWFHGGYPSSQAMSHYLETTYALGSREYCCIWSREFEIEIEFNENET